jgi:hypothetical protein
MYGRQQAICRTCDACFLQGGVTPSLNNPTKCHPTFSFDILVALHKAQLLNMSDAYFLPLAKRRSACTRDGHATDCRPSKSHSQNNRLVLLLHDFQFAKLHHDDTICPMAESILQHTLWRSMRTETQRYNERVSYCVSTRLDLVFCKPMAAQPQYFLLPTYGVPHKALSPDATQ